MSDEQPRDLSRVRALRQAITQLLTDEERREYEREQFALHIPKPGVATGAAIPYREGEPRR
jgi:hypothetical protein